MNCFPAFIAAVGLLLVPAVHAQNYPSKPVRILTVSPNGSPGDTMTRGVAQTLSRSTGQAFVVENRPGADGLIAGEACAKAAPDGYTLCMLDNYGLSLNPVIRTRMPYDSARDLTPVIHLGFGAGAVLVHPSVPANTLGELFELAKAKPDSLAWGANAGVGSSSYLYITWLKKAKGISFLNVPYKVPLQAWQALLAGEIQVVNSSVITAVSQVKAGKVRALAVSMSSRSPLLPDVPTFKEAGMDVAIVTWFGIVAPSATPKAIIQRLNMEIVKEVYENAPVKEKLLAAAGLTVLFPTGGSPEAFAEFLKSEHEMFSDLVRVTGVKVDQ